ncbi:MAG: hypothetical protein HC880_00335 [Bacteroidia bacterium]|nr:hypothetical protein [Bacteroidia bacterium]
MKRSGKNPVPARSFFLERNFPLLFFRKELLGFWLSNGLFSADLLRCLVWLNSFWFLLINADIGLYPQGRSPQSAVPDQSKNCPHYGLSLPCIFGRSFTWLMHPGQSLFNLVQIGTSIPVTLPTHPDLKEKRDSSGFSCR